MADQSDGRRPTRDISTAEDLPFVRIDGADYELRLDVEYAEILRMRDVGRRVDSLSDKKDRTEQDEAELSDLLRRSVRQMLKDAPEEVLAGLRDLQRFAIVSAWNDEAMGVLNPTGAGAGRPSRDSNGSTAGR